MAESPIVVPHHLGIILDGNRRWAKARGLPPSEGHKESAKTFRDIVEAAFSSGVKVLTVYAFSTENWKRSPKEVQLLLSLLIRSIKREITALDERGIRVVFLGTKQKLSRTVLQAMQVAEQQTAQNQKGTLAICFNYGGHQELAEAMQSIVRQDYAPEDVTTETIAANLYYPELPPLDMIIRTSGEHRLSNFMLWRAAYAELYFTDTLWPDFTPAHLQEALAEYARRDRRLGA
jgi:undecaprenyl diphosphate synthase